MVRFPELVLALIQVRVLRQNIDHIFADPEVLATLIKDGIANRQKILLQDGREVIICKDWGTEIVIPDSFKVIIPKEDKGKGKGKHSVKASQNSVPIDKEQESPRQENATAEVELNPNPEAAPEQSNQEVEVTNENAQPLNQGPLFSFEPLNPDNADGTKEQSEAKGPAENFPLTSTLRHHENRSQTDTLSPRDSQLNVFGIPAEFPLTNNSLEGERTNRSIYELHMELAPYGYNLKKGNIVNCSPLDNQARSSSKIPIVIDYKNPQTDKMSSAQHGRLIYGTQGCPKGTIKRRAEKVSSKTPSQDAPTQTNAKRKKNSLCCQAQGTAKAQAKTRVALAKQRTSLARPERMTEKDQNRQGNKREKSQRRDPLHSIKRGNHRRNKTHTEGNN